MHGTSYSDEDDDSDDEDLPDLSDVPPSDAQGAPSEVCLFYTCSSRMVTKGDVRTDWHCLLLVEF